VAREFLGVDFSFGDPNQQNLDIHDMRWRSAPSDLQDAHKQARKWTAQNYILQALQNLRAAFLNFGFELRAEKAADRARLAAWLAEQPKRWRGLRRYVNEVVREWNMQSSVVTFWRDDFAERGALPFLLLPETVKYSDAMGMEVLRVVFAWSKAELKEPTMDMPSWLVDRYGGKKDVLLDEAQGEFFAVVTRGLRGRGLAWPDLTALYRILSESESLEVGESQFGYMSRLVYEQHSIGFEAKNAVTAQHQARFLYDKKRAANIEGDLTGKLGLARLITQFDHKIGHVWSGKDPAAFDARKWATITERVRQWAGPIGLLYTERAVNPGLLKLLEVQMLAEREDFLGPYLEEVLNTAVMPPGLRVQVRWGRQCFKDERLAWQMTNGLIQAGPSSLTTGLRVAGFDPEDEGLQKEEEAKPENSKKFLPLFDPNHGNRPGETSTGGGGGGGGKGKKLPGKAGRPDGVKDGEGE